MQSTEFLSSLLRQVHFHTASAVIQPKRTPSSCGSVFLCHCCGLGQLNPAPLAPLAGCSPLGLIGTITHRELSSQTGSKVTQQPHTQLSDLLSSAKAESASLMSSMLQMPSLWGNGVLTLALKVRSLNYILCGCYIGKKSGLAPSA